VNKLGVFTLIVLCAFSTSSFPQGRKCGAKSVYGPVREVLEHPQDGWETVVLVETTSGVPLQRRFCGGPEKGKSLQKIYGLGFSVLTEVSQNSVVKRELLDRFGHLRVLQTIDYKSESEVSKVFAANGTLIGSVTLNDIQISEPFGIKLLSPNQRYGSRGNDSIDHVYAVSQLLFQQHKKSDITEVIIAWMLAYVGEGTGQWRDFAFRDWMLSEPVSAIALFSKLDAETARIIAGRISYSIDSRQLDRFQTLYADQTGPGIDELKHFVSRKQEEMKRATERYKLKNGQSKNVVKDEERLPQQ
jgi:hypothetical protein